VIVGVSAQSFGWWIVGITARLVGWFAFKARSGRIRIVGVSQAYRRDGNQDRRHISTIVVSFVDRGRIGAII